MRIPRFVSISVLAVLLAACASVPPAIPVQPADVGAHCPPAPACPVCAACPVAEAPKPAAPALQAAQWSDLPGWTQDDPGSALAVFVGSCPALLANDKRRALWAESCAAARAQGGADATQLRAWFEAQFRPWSLHNPDDSDEGLVTGYYEPLIRGRRSADAQFRVPVFAPPEDLIVVELAALYPELKHLRLRGRLEGNKLLPYYSREEWDAQENARSAKALLWTDDPIDFFFLQIQGSGQVLLEDGSRVRIGYADQNGHPYRSIGRYLIERGELAAGEASMQGIKGWARAHPERLRELLAVNPSLVFFRELPVQGNGPPGALGVPLTPGRSIAVDPRHLPLGAPVFLATTRPNSGEALNRLMFAQDTGGAIRGVVRADFYWGSGSEALAEAGKMRQRGRAWLLLPRNKGPQDLGN